MAEQYYKISSNPFLLLFFFFFAGRAQMCQMTMEDMERKGMTTGAAKKLCKKLDELK